MANNIQAQSLVRKTWRRRVRILLSVFCLLCLTFIVLVLGVRAYVLHIANKKLEATIAELDRKDPNWRWDDIMAQREVIPDEQNSARFVLAAAKLLPDDWPNKPAAPSKKPDKDKKVAGLRVGENEGETLTKRLADVEPNHLLNAELEKDLREELKAVAPTLTEARPLITASKGRYQVQWTKDFLTTSMKHARQAREIAGLFWFEAFLRAQEGEIDEGLASSRAALNAGRTLGDEPTFISQLVRIASAAVAFNSLERVLAMGETSDRALRLTQELLEDEIGGIQARLLIATRGERAALLGTAEMLYAGEMSFEGLSKGYVEKWHEKLWAWLYSRPLVRYNQHHLLETMTRAVENVQKRPKDQFESFDEFKDDLKRTKASSPHLFLAPLLVPAVSKLAEAHIRMTVTLSCARLAIGAERYRLKFHKWPDSLRQLLPDFVADLPEDLYGKGFLLYRRTDYGVVIYSVGPDKEDNQGNIQRKLPQNERGTDIGFRLWDVKHRRQPAKTTDSSP